MTTTSGGSAASDQDGAVLEMDIGGARLPYVDQGHGPVIVFLHGALGDLRLWERHAAALAGRYRVVRLTQRYFGTAEWGRDWPPFGVETHSRDLTAFLAGLGAGPVHLVAWSYSGHVALDAALRRPEQLASVLIHEPGVPTYLNEAEREAFRADAARMYGPLHEAVQRGADLREVVRRLMDGSSQRPGHFDAQPEESRRLQMDSARTMPLLMAQAPPPDITCEQLGRLRVPVCIAQGERTRPVFGVVARAAARCIPGCRHLVVPGAGHLWPDEDVPGFVAAVADFVEAARGLPGGPRP